MGPGIILITPKDLELRNDTLDVLPQQKWAEEGYAVVNITTGAEDSLKTSIDLAVKSLQTLESCDVKDKYFMIGGISPIYWRYLLIGF